jgi:dTDP-4-dehydrorhamnose reductase
MKVVILGSTGMLGNMVSKEFLSWLGPDNVRCSRRSKDIQRPVEFQFYLIEYPCMYEFNIIPECDYVINCIGVIKPHVEKNMRMTILANSLMPHKLANYCEAKGIKLINITTDCVFSGKRGAYNENDLHDCEDAYGKSKSLGEPPNCMNLRTSIIGPEIDGRATSLIEIVKQSKGKEFKAFSNWFWNGVTTKQYANICQQIIEYDLFKPGTFHVFSNAISKGQLIYMLNDKYELGLQVVEYKAPHFCDRTLSTVRDLCSKLNIPSIKEQIGEL